MILYNRFLDLNYKNQFFYLNIYKKNKKSSIIKKISFRFLEQEKNNNFTVCLKYRGNIL